MPGSQQSVSGNISPGRQRRPRMLHWCAALLLCAAGASPAWSSCTPPPQISSKWAAHPSAQNYGELGDWFAMQHRFFCAAEVFRKAVALEPASSQFHYLLGLSLSSSGDAKSAIPELQQALRLDPASLQAHLALADTLDHSGRRNEAETEWRLALAQDPHSTLALQRLSRDLLAGGQYSEAISLLTPYQSAGALSNDLIVSLSVAYTKTGLLQKASALLTSALHRSPSSYPLAGALAGVLMLQSRFQEAVGILAPFARQNPQSLPVQTLYFHTLVLAQDSGAETLGKRLLIRAPHSWELLYLMGLLRQRAGDAPAAERYLTASSAANPAYADTHYRLGVALAHLNNNSAAEKQLQQAIALGLTDPEVHFELAKVLRSTGDAAGATQQIVLYQNLLQTQAHRAQAADKAQQADQAESTGNLQQAIADYRDAAALDPAEPVFAYKLAMACDRAGDHAGERAALNQAVQLNPSMAMAQNQLGYLDNAEGRTNSAVQRFRLAVQADPSYTRAWLNLAAALCLQSQWQQARDALGHVLALDPSDVPAKDLLQRIAQLQ